MPRFHIYIPYALVALLVALACTKIFVRTKTIEIGYRLGELKKVESQLIERKSRLQMQLSKLSTRQKLQELSFEDYDHSFAGK